MPTNNATNANTTGVQTLNATTGVYTASTTTQFDVLVGGANNTIANITPGAAGTILRSGGVGANPTFSSSTYPSNVLPQAILFSSSSNVIGGLTPVNSSIVSYNGSGNLQASTTPSATSITLNGGTALSNYTEGTFTPTLIGGSTAGVTAYTTQAGTYTRIGNLVTIFGNITITGGTGTGNMLLGGFPFTIKNQTTSPNGNITINGTLTWPGSATGSLAVGGLINSTTAVIVVSKTASATALMQFASVALTITYTLTYQI